MLLLPSIVKSKQQPFYFVLFCYNTLFCIIVNFHSMAFSSTLVFKVKRCEPELVVPANPTPQEIRKLSDIDDQEGLRFQMSLLVFYKNNPSMNGKDPVAVLREGLAKTLDYYYPFAGRIVEGDDRKLMVNCNGEGVLFVEANANITLEQLGDSLLPPCPFVDEFLHDVPGSGGIVGCPLLLIQVTRLFCGGFALGIRFNHTMADGGGIYQFVIAITEFVKGASAPSILPVWQREEYLSARSPPRITCKHNEYSNNEQVPHSISSSTHSTMDPDNLIQAAVFFNAEEIQALRDQMSSSGNLSRFELIAACLWKCRTAALSPVVIDPEDLVHLSVITNLRGKRGLNIIPTGYYGNAIIFPAAVSTARILCTSPISYAVDLIQKAKAQVSEEYVKSVADLMVIKKRPKFSSWNYLVSDTSRLGYEKLDFGWGSPVHGGTHFVTPDFSFFTYTRNSKGEDGVAVSICLPPIAVEPFKLELKKTIYEPVTCSSIGA